MILQKNYSSNSYDINCYYTNIKDCDDFKITQLSIYALFNFNLFII